VGAHRLRHRELDTRHTLNLLSPMTRRDVDQPGFGVQAESRHRSGSPVNVSYFDLHRHCKHRNILPWLSDLNRSLQFQIQLPTMTRLDSTSTLQIFGTVVCTQRSKSS
jgi:hypothetical protein